MNFTALIGRLTKPAEIRTTAEGLAIASFTLAVDRQKKDAGADFISCRAFGRTAEIIEQYTGKGSQIGIQGHIKTGKYENKEGKTVYTTDVIVDRLELLGSKKDSAQQTSAPTEEPPAGFEALTDDAPF